jgi:ferredoxin
VIVDERLIREARRCREMWHSLQELGGIHNSHAEALLARERVAWDQRVQQAEPPMPAAIVTAPVAAAARVASPAAVREPERSPDEAYIETVRCSTCNECTTINSKMFAYDQNKQAYIADVTAGTYAQLVAAAESCQVAVIHPGRPRNPQEPDLEDLLKRAAPFR